MAVDIVLAIGTSHSPSLNSPAEDYPKHAAIDASGRKLLDKQGRPTTYGALLEKSDPSIKDQIAPRYWKNAQRVIWMPPTQQVKRSCLAGVIASLISRNLSFKCQSCSEMPTSFSFQ